MTLNLPQPVVLHFQFGSRGKQIFFHVPLLLLMITAFIFCTSCSVGARSNVQPAIQAESNRSSINTGMDAKTGTRTNSIINLPVVKLEQASPLSQVTQQLADARVILVGESHTRLDHHMVQLEILKRLHQQSQATSPNKSSGLAIGVEWFQQPSQQTLDAYIAGSLSEAEMLKQTGYYENWRYDYRLYRPILQYARLHNIPVIALNAPKELTHALSKSGFDDLPAELKAQLPTSYDWSDKAYENRLREAFGQHPDYLGKFEDFLRVQLTWDESMAERATKYLENHPGSRLLIFAGSGHIAYGSGIPNRIIRRIDVEQYSVLVSEDYQPFSESSADYLVLSPVQSLAPVGLIGALLETEGQLLVIKGFSENSAVKDAGLEKGTVIIGVDDSTVASFAEFKLAVLDKKPGDSIELHYIDNTKGGGKDRKSIRLELR